MRIAKPKKSGSANQRVMQVIYPTFDAYREAVHKPGNPRNAQNTRQTGNYSWTHTNSYEEALELMDKGWPEGLANIHKLKDMIKVPTVQTETQFMTYEVAGDEPDIGRYVTGEPENMIEYKRQYIPGSGRVVSLILNPAISSGIEPEAIILRGAACYALCDAIEETGLRVEISLHMVVGSNGDDSWGEVIVPVKAADQSIEPDRLAFILGHPSSFRRLMARNFEQQPPELYSKHWPRWGRPRDLDPVPEDAVYFGSMLWSALSTPESCAKYVQQMLNRYTQEQYGAE